MGLQHAVPHVRSLLLHQSLFRLLLCARDPGQESGGHREEPDGRRTQDPGQNGQEDELHREPQTHTDSDISCRVNHYPVQKMYFYDRRHANMLSTKVVFHVVDLGTALYLKFVLISIDYS